jgi:hypothetical protein
MRRSSASLGQQETLQPGRTNFNYRGSTNTPPLASAHSEQKELVTMRHTCLDRLVLMPATVVQRARSASARSALAPRVLPMLTSKIRRKRYFGPIDVSQKCMRTVQISGIISRAHWRTAAIFATSASKISSMETVFWPFFPFWEGL